MRDIKREIKFFLENLNGGKVLQESKYLVSSEAFRFLSKTISYAPRNKQGHLSIKKYDYCQRIEKGRDDYITYYSRSTRFIFMNLIFCLCMFI